MRPRSLLWMLLLPASAGVLGAETPMTEESFLAAVDDAHPAIRALGEDLGRAEAERRRVGVLSDPILDLSQEELDNVERERVVSLAWTPPLDGRRRWAVRAAEAGVSVERSRLAWRAAERRQAAREDYAAWAVARARVGALEEYERNIDELAARMRRRAASGEESLLDARRFEMVSDTAGLELSRAKAAEAEARSRADAWLARSGGVDSGVDDVSGEPRLPGLPPAPGDLEAGERPDLVAARSRVRETEALGKLSRRFVVAPEILLGWKEVDIVGRDLDGPVVALNWTVPVFDRRQGDRLEAERALDVAMAQEEWTAARAKSDLEAALAAYSGLRGAALSAADGTEDLEGVSRAATAAFEQGESSVTDLLDTLRTVLDARLAWLETHAAALAAHRRLELAGGRALTSGDES